MNTAFRKPCFSAILCGAALLAPQARAQSADSAGILSTTPQSVEDLQRIEHQLQQVLPRVLPALVCIEVNNSVDGTGILVSEKGLIFSAAHVVDKQGTVLKIILPDGFRLPGKTTAQNSDSDAGAAEITTKLNKDLPRAWRRREETAPRGGLGVRAWARRRPWTRNAARWCAWGRVVVSLKHGVIQTDCKLIRGDSGGPLFNLNGELIGIHGGRGSGLEDNLPRSHEGFRRTDGISRRRKGPPASVTGTGRLAFFPPWS